MRVTKEPEAELAAAIDALYAQDLRRTSSRIIAVEVLKVLIPLGPLYAAGSVFGYGVQHHVWSLCWWGGLVAVCVLARYWVDLYRSRRL